MGVIAHIQMLLMRITGDRGLAAVFSFGAAVRHGKAPAVVIDLLI